MDSEDCGRWINPPTVVLPPWSEDAGLPHDLLLSVNIEVDIRDVLGDIKRSIDKLDTKFDKLSEDVNAIKVELAATRAELKGEIKALDEKVDGINKSLGEKIDGIGKRVDTQEFINRGVILGLLIAILGGVAKLFWFS